MPALTMPLYVDHDDVILRMQINGTLPGVTDVVDSAIISAQLQVQGIIQGNLEEIAQDSTFFLDDDAFSAIQPGGVFRLEIPSGFIRTDTPVTITFDSEWNQPNPQTADPTLYKVDNDRGYVLMDAKTYHGQFVRVQCSTGFAVDVPVPSYSGSPTVYDSGTAYTVGQAVTFNGSTYVCIQDATGNEPDTSPLFWTVVVLTPEQLPPEIYEAIMDLVSVVFDASQTTNRNQEAQPQAKKAFDRAQLLLLPYLRMKGFSFRPMWT